MNVDYLLNTNASLSLAYHSQRGCTFSMLHFSCVNSQQVSVTPVKCHTLLCIKTFSWLIPHSSFISTQAFNTFTRLSCYLFLSCFWPYSELHSEPQHLFSSLPLFRVCALFSLPFHHFPGFWPLSTLFWLREENLVGFVVFVFNSLDS